jgi:NAD(P)-dependent dehydrogenase (short-subunit alcohol dehydrogenase family)
MQVSGSTVLLTGANGGIGFALVVRLLERGAGRVYATDVVLDRLSTLADDRVVPLELDVTDDGEIAAAAAPVERLDLLDIFPDRMGRGVGELWRSSPKEVERRFATV